MRTDEEGRLPRLDRIAVAIGGARDDEQLVAIGFDLGELVRLQRILDRERMQADAPGDAGKDRQSTRLNSSHHSAARMPSSDSKIKPTTAPPHHTHHTPH